MVEVELKKSLRLDNLRKENIFDDLELIIDLDNKSMTTITRELNYLDHGKESEISVRRYNILIDSDGFVRRLNYNGYNECPTDESDHKRFKKMLKEVELW